jgi:hypothetical protein
MKESRSRPHAGKLGLAVRHARDRLACNQVRGAEGQDQKKEDASFDR